MSLVGRLDLAVDGRPLSLEALGERISIGVPRLRDALHLRRASHAAAADFAAACEHVGLGAELRVGGWLRLPIAPRPHWIVRWLLPAARA